MKLENWVQLYQKAHKCRCVGHCSEAETAKILDKEWAQMSSQRPPEAQNGPATDELTERQRRALAALLAAPTAKEAAKIANVGERTLKRWRTLPAFQQAYRAAQSELLESAVCQSRQNLTGALSALSAITADENAPPAARVSAARASVELALKLGEQNDILTRLDELERTMGGDKTE